MDVYTKELREDLRQERQLSAKKDSDLEKLSEAVNELEEKNKHLTEYFEEAKELQEILNNMEIFDEDTIKNVALNYQKAKDELKDLESKFEDYRKLSEQETQNLKNEFSEKELNLNKKHNDHIASLKVKWEEDKCNVIALNTQKYEQELEYKRQELVLKDNLIEQEKKVQEQIKEDH